MISDPSQPTPIFRIVEFEIGQNDSDEYFVRRYDRARGSNLVTDWTRILPTHPFIQHVSNRQAA